MLAGDHLNTPPATRIPPLPQYATVIKAVQQITDPAARKAAAIAQGLPARVSLMANFTSAWPLRG